MTGWAIVAIIAIVVWGIVESVKAKSGIVTDENGAERRIESRDAEAQREIEELRERIKVLERIATENNSLDARERARVTREIEALREDLD